MSRPKTTVICALAAILLLPGAGAGLLPLPAAAAPLADRDPQPVREGRVASVTDGDTLTLADGAQVRLSGIQAPKLPLGRPGFRPWPLAAEAKQALEELALGRAVRLDYDGRRIDRWRRLLAQVHAGPVWLQHEMLRLGLARVYTFADNRTHAAALYAAEHAARAAGRGIWADPWYRIHSPDEAGRAIGTFQLVEGTPVSVAIVNRRAYLNYGDDWRTDFTVSVAPRDMALFRRAGVDLKSLRGVRIRVRGWIVRRNGAMISITHPEQIELLEAK